VGRERPSLKLLGATKLDATLHVILAIASRPQPLRLGLDGRSQHEHAERLRSLQRHLLGTLDVDLQHHVATLRRVGQRGAVEIVEDVRPLEEAAGGDVGLEGGLVDEVICIRRLAGAARSRRP
jgi:hypothetical protein